MNTDLSELDQQVNASGLGDNALEDSGPGFSAEGFFHFQITDIEKTQYNSLQFKMECLAGTDKSQVGKTLYTFVALSGKDGAVLSDKQLRIIMRFAYGLGLVSKQDVGRPNVVIPWSRALNTQCIGEVSFQPGSDKPGGGRYKDRYALAYGRVWQVTDPAVSEVPKDTESLAAARIVVPSSSGQSADIDI